MFSLCLCTKYARFVPGEALFHVRGTIALAFVRVRHCLTYWKRQGARSENRCPLLRGPGIGSVFRRYAYSNPYTP